MLTDNQRKSQAMRRLSDKLFDKDGEFEWSEEYKEARFFLQNAVSLQRIEVARDTLRAKRVALEPGYGCVIVAIFEGVQFPWEL